MGQKGSGGGGIKPKEEEKKNKYTIPGIGQRAEVVLVYVTRGFKNFL